MASLKEKYIRDVRPRLMSELGLTNKLAAPRLEKVVVNMGIGVADKDAVKTHVEELARITGQKPQVTKARKSISNFKIRSGMNIGAKVTLRGDRMYEFLQRLIDSALPRIRDFRGIPKNSFDGSGNYTLGIKEQIIFPEIDPDKISQTQGMDITIVTSAQDDKSGLALLKLLGFPFSGK